jgi:hypothetical protein
MSSSVVSRRQLIALTAFAVVLVILAVGYTVHVGRRDAARRPSAPPATAQSAQLFDGTPQLVFRNTELGAGYGQVATVPLADPTAARAYTTLSCDRAYAAAGTVLCLTSDRGVVTTYHAVIYDKELAPIRSLVVAGLPSRARISSDGRMASWTVFVYGDSYVSRTFSTRTAILDVKTGAMVDNLESFTIVKDGAKYQSPDVNFWGVTFATDDNTFYATLATKGQTYLVRGDLAARTVTTLRTNVECPSLSPDGTRLVFKKKVSSDVRKPWRLAVLDLATMKETLLAEPQSVDDQAAWLDNGTVMYSLPEQNAAITDVWKVPADGTGAPQLLVKGAFSPALTS